MKFIVEQRMVSTDYYEVEAESLSEAEKVYEKTKGELHSLGSTGGWKYNQSVQVVINPRVNPRYVPPKAGK